MLVGRDDELVELERLLDGARAGVPTLALVEGPAGIGKSLLLRTFTSRIQGIHVRYASGLQWEAHHAGSVLQQVTGSPVDTGDPVAAAHTVVESLTEPAVIVVDDAHWADLPSLQALLSMLRRAQGHAVLVVFVVPDVLPRDVDPDTAALFDSHHGVGLRLGPLTSSDIAELALRRAGIDLSPWTAQRLHEHTLGNPRPVLELLDEIPRAQWGLWRDRFPAPRRHTAAVNRALADCAPETRALVEATVVAGDGAALTLVAELAETPAPTDQLDEAFRAGILVARERRGVVTLWFRDPMTRAVVMDEIGPARWHTLHSKAAELVDDEGAALFHLVSASPLIDGNLADRLDKFADDRSADGTWSLAGEALITASRITPERELRTERLIRGVDALTGAADLPQAQTFVPEIESAPGGPMRNAVLGYLAIQRGRVAEAHQLLTEAWRLVGNPPADPELGAMIAQRMVLQALAGLRGDELVTWADRTISLVPATAPAAVEAAAIRGLGLGMTGRIDEARNAYSQLPGSARLGAQSQRIRMAEGWLALALGDPDQARTALESAEPTTFRGGSLRISLWAQAWLARTQFDLGDWSEAARTVDRAAAQLDSTGLDLLRPLVHWTGAQVHSLRGNWPTAYEHVRRARAGSNDYAIMFVPSCLAAAQCAEVSGDYEAVVRHLRPLLTLPYRDGLDEPGFWPWPDLYGNALVMTGRIDEADEFLRPHEERAATRGHRSSEARLGYVRGRIHGARGEINEARDAFENALAKITSLPVPYARARVNFAYGQTMRRAGRRREADVVIRTARDAYLVLGATSYVERCDRELQAGGLRSAGAEARSSETQSRSNTDVTLTPQERAVASLVAAGHTNKEVAGELFLSVKTVQYHLTRVYAKFGIRSRSELAARFREEE